jgi:serine/threonine-protein kinase HipA
VVGAFLWGLLPDNEQVLDRWGRTYQVSPRNPFALLRHVGEDCAGAAQFVVPQRLPALQAGKGDVRWLTESEVAERLRVLRRDPAAWHVHNTGQFSLAGAQAKTALYRDPATGQWGEPSGAVATTHIVKPAVAGLDDHDLIEHLCLAAAKHVGLPAASSSIASFGAERAVVVERYDRRSTASGAVRIHQEDLCQALGVPPTTKYQNEGGPTPEQIVELLRTATTSAAVATDSVNRFVDALAFNWLIGGTDAHAKNYSLLLAGAQVRLAPLYDLASALVYDDLYLPRLRMAMKIGGEYGVTAVCGRHWRRFADAVGLDPDGVVDRIAKLAARTPDAFAMAVEAPDVRELESPLAGRMADRIASAVADCHRRLGR